MPSVNSLSIPIHTFTHLYTSQFFVYRISFSTKAAAVLPKTLIEFHLWVNTIGEHCELPPMRVRQNSLCLVHKSFSLPLYDHMPYTIDIHKCVYG